MQLLQHPLGQELIAQISEIAKQHSPEEAQAQLRILLESYISSGAIESQCAQARSYTYHIYQELENLLRLVFKARQWLEDLENLKNTVLSD